MTGSMRGGRIESVSTGGRNRFRSISILVVYIAPGWLLPGRKRVVPYSIHTLNGGRIGGHCKRGRRG